MWSTVDLLGMNPACSWWQQLLVESNSGESKMQVKQLAWDVEWCNTPVTTADQLVSLSFPEG